MMPRLPLPQRQAAHHEPSQSPQHPPPERVPFAVAKLRLDLLAKHQRGRRFNFCCHDPCLRPWTARAPKHIRQDTH